jgi:hypothetical protein
LHAIAAFVKMLKIFKFKLSVLLLSYIVVIKSRIARFFGADKPKRKNIPKGSYVTNGHEIYQTFPSFQNIPKLVFLVCKYTKICNRFNETMLLRKYIIIQKKSKVSTAFIRTKPFQFFILVKI